MGAFGCRAWRSFLLSDDGSRACATRTAIHVESGAASSKEAGGEAYYQHSPYETKYGGRFELNLQRRHITQSEEPSETGVL